MESLVLFLPLLGALLAGLGGAKLGDKFACWVSCLCVLATAILGGFLFADAAFGEGGARSVLLAPWIQTPSFEIVWSLRLDTLSTLMIAVVSSVSALVHIYAVDYMKDDRGRARFMSFLSLFTFFMLMLVSADNLVQLFFGWEGVGLMSYLLIGFWYEKPRAAAAGVKAFLMNRVGDFGFLLGIFGCADLFGSLDLSTIFERVQAAHEAFVVIHGVQVPMLELVAGLLFMGAVAKSAQLGLHTWLPDAMEGPTPVSALIHAATMVTAGVFMIARLSPLFHAVPNVLFIVGCFGAATALFGATCALVQTDIKRVIAYSTMSQLGYMFMALGVSAYGAALFHLATHAFFKALLFLGAGSVIHALHGEQDLRQMGGLRRKMPVTYGLMLIGSLAIAGIGFDGAFGFSGFYSKEMILQAAFAHGGFGLVFYAIGVLGAEMTAFYSFRLIFLAFHGRERHPEAHEASKTMLLPLIPLALGALFAGFLAAPWFGEESSSFWKDAIVTGESLAHSPEWASLLPLLAALLGIGVAGFLYILRPHLPLCIIGHCGGFIRCVIAGFHIDDLYAALFVHPIEKMARVFWRLGDDRVIDTLGPDGIGRAALRLGKKTASYQTGFVYHYAFAMVAGVAFFVALFCLR